MIEWILIHLWIQTIHQNHLIICLYERLMYVYFFSFFLSLFCNLPHILHKHTDIFHYFLCFLTVVCLLGVFLPIFNSLSFVQFAQIFVKYDKYIEQFTFDCVNYTNICEICASIFTNLTNICVIYTIKSELFHYIQYYIT